mmetsp:Transcript_1227/g.3904  ORF Transcript_1227/g.3904 Transcript_1227/m.3904 type:complete len:203 (-) Transcript_1227:702-1310(-)
MGRVRRRPCRVEPSTVGVDVRIGGCGRDITGAPSTVDRHAPLLQRQEYVIVVENLELPHVVDPIREKPECKLWRVDTRHPQAEQARRRHWLREAEGKARHQPAPAGPRRRGVCHSPRLEPSLEVFLGRGSALLYTSARPDAMMHVGGGTEGGGAFGGAAGEDGRRRLLPAEARRRDWRRELQLERQGVLALGDGGVVCEGHV